MGMMMLNFNNENEGGLSMIILPDLDDVKRFGYEDYILHVEDGDRISFTVYQAVGYIEKYQDADYVSNCGNNEMIAFEDFDTDICTEKMCGSYSWRGVWDERLYFNDDEYWGSELGDLHELYQGFIKLYCQFLIKSKHPEYTYDD